MGLTRNQVVHDVQKVLDGRMEVATARLQGRPAKAVDRNLSQAEATLKRSVARARDVWPGSRLANRCAHPVDRPDLAARMSRTSSQGVRP